MHRSWPRTSPQIRPHALATLCLAACVGKHDDSSAPDSVDTATPWPPEPSRYDCSAAPAERWIARDPTCATDRSCADLLVSGHRGAGGELGVIAPEDTVIAVNAAVAWGLDLVETDPRPTADGYLVNLHDTTVDRTTDGTGEASDMTLAEIQALNVDVEGYEGDFSCARVPTLEEVLDAARGRVHVLVDANKTDRVDLLVAAITSTDTLDWAIFDTSSVDKIDEALALEPRLHTMIRVDDEAQLAEQIAHFEAHPPVIVEIDATVPELATAVREAGHRALMDVFLGDAAAMSNGSTRYYESTLDEGVQILQTDRPDLLLPVVWAR